MNFRSIAILLVTASWFPFVTGCPVFQNTDVPGEIQKLHEPVNGGDYYLYVPSNYSADKQYAAVITCHGTKPWDTAQRQAQEWVDLAESKQFIVAAPELTGTRGDYLWSDEEQIQRQQADEKTILAVLDHVRAAYNIADDRVFLTGWSAGGYAVLYTGLRNPTVFRALALRQGNFKARLVNSCLPFADPHQPIYVLYGATDVLLKDQADECLEWLRENRLYAVEEETIGSHRRHPDLAYRFFRKCLQKYAWAHLRATPASKDDPMLIAFEATCSPEPTAWLWRFGDGEYAREASPTHRYREPGRYEVKLTGRAKNSQFVRQMVIDVPGGRTAPANQSSLSSAASGAAALDADQ